MFVHEGLEILYGHFLPQLLKRVVQILDRDFTRVASVEQTEHTPQLSVT